MNRNAVLRREVGALNVGALTLVAVSLGCAWNGASGRTHLVLGIGFVTTRHPPPPAADICAQPCVAEAIRASGVLIGAPLASGDALVIGTASSSCVQVPADAQVLVVIGDVPSIHPLPSTSVAVAPESVPHAKRSPE
ncbi:MAG: hypothetical protein EPO68_16000 [Planctomycetota bacterium]|nr:MAG: hypothetical protein EPO68_16000 [Planctomycetota bacterium]